MFFDKIRNNLHARGAAAALPGASAETKATGVGDTVMLASRFKTGTENPHTRVDSTAAHTHMNMIFACITLVAPGLTELSCAEMKKEDASVLQLLKQPSLDRQSQTG